LPLLALEAARDRASRAGKHATRSSTHLNSSATLNSRSSSMSPMVGLRWLLKAASVVYVM
jgi:hypothetical protein